MSLKNNFGSKEKTTLFGAIISLALFALVLYFSRFSVGSIVDLQNHILKTILLQTGETNTIGAIVMLLKPFTWVFVSLVFFVLGFAFLNSYGFFSTEKRIGFICGITGAILTLVLLNVSIASIFLAVALIIGSVYIIPLSNTYAKELKKWVLFRTGSHSISKILLITNILIATGIFLAIFSNLPVYEDSFKEDITESMTTVALASIPKTQVFLSDQSRMQELEDQVREQVEKSVDESPIFNSYIRWLPATSAFTIWVLLEFLRGLILSNIGGAFSSGITRFLKRKV